MQVLLFRETRVGTLEDLPFDCPQRRTALTAWKGLLLSSPVKISMVTDKPSKAARPAFSAWSFQKQCVHLLFCLLQAPGLNPSDSWLLTPGFTGTGRLTSWSGRQHRAEAEKLPPRVDSLESAPQGESPQVTSSGFPTSEPRVRSNPWKW